MKYSVEHAGRSVEIDLTEGSGMPVHRSSSDAAKLGAEPSEELGAGSSARAGARSAMVDGQTIDFEWSVAGGRRLLRIGHRLHRIDDIEISDGLVRFSLDGVWVETSVRDERDLLLERLGFNRPSGARDSQLNAPMPGKIHQLLVQVGDQVEMDQPVVILEAMKMENELKSPVKGTITCLHVSTGSSVEKNQPILEIDPIG